MDDIYQAAFAAILVQKFNIIDLKSRDFKKSKLVNFRKKIRKKKV